MSSFVQVQTIGSSEHFAALVAHQRTGVAVYPHVNVEDGLCVECLVTHLAHKRLLSCVDPFMLLQQGKLGELLGTLAALVWEVSCVGVRVPLQPRVSPE